MSVISNAFLNMVHLSQNEREILLVSKIHDEIHEWSEIISQEHDNEPNSNVTILDKTEDAKVKMNSVHYYSSYLQRTE